jgi:Zn-dependent protease with chaperone function
LPPALGAQTSGRAKSPAEAAPAPPAPEKAEVKRFTLPPEKYEQAIAYRRARYWHYFIHFAYGVLIFVLVLQWRWAPRFRDWAERFSRRRFLQALVFVALFSLATGVLVLPSVIYYQYLSLKYDQSVQCWPSWFWDFTKGQLIGIVISTILVWILYAAIRRSARRWWFYFWLATLPIIVLLLFLAPFVIEPLFFKFEPLEKTQPALVPEIEKVVARGGLAIPRERMFEMKASEKRKSVSAYVTGVGAAKRVVFWDTTLEKMTVPQALFVFGHEMGHYVLWHIPRTIAVFWFLLLVFFYLGYRGLERALTRWGQRWEIRGQEDWASLPVFLLLLSLISFVATPIFSSYSRWQEHQADIYGLEVIHGIVPHSQQAAADAFQILGEINLADPEPPAFIKFWLYDHPALVDRIVFAQTYDPWSKGEEPRYVK